MPTIDWPFVLYVSVGLTVFLAAVYFGLKRLIEGAPTAGPPRCCLRCGWPHAVRERTTGSIDCGACLFPWNPGHPLHPDALSHDVPTEVDIPLDELGPQPFVNAQATPITIDDAEFVRCKLCRAPLSSLTADCWVCSTRKGAA